MCSGVACGFAGASFGARRDEIPIHGPMVVLAKGEAVGGVVVLALGKRDEGVRTRAEAARLRF
jgi:hypothetical protein